MLSRLEARDASCLENEKPAKMIAKCKEPESLGSASMECFCFHKFPMGKLGISSDVCSIQDNKVCIS